MKWSRLRWQETQHYIIIIKRTDAFLAEIAPQ
jgi:hypothetical protein